jgi:hypothetical protein
MPRIPKLTLMAFLMPITILASKMFVIPSGMAQPNMGLSNNNCPPLSTAAIPLDHPIVGQLNKQYREEGSVRYREDLYGRERFTLNTEWADPNSRVTSLVKVGDYGLARWGRKQTIVVYFKKNQLGLYSSDLVGHFTDTCINCLDAAAAVESAERILKRHDVTDADIKCIDQLDSENSWRLYGRNGLW